MTGASAALHLSDIVVGRPARRRPRRPHRRPVRRNPTFAEREKSDIDLVVAAHASDAIMMVEGELQRARRRTS